MILNKQTSKNNYYSFIWHGLFLALASSFMDIDTVMSAMLGSIDGTPFQYGLLTTIMLGGSSFSQIFFSPYISRQPKKKPFLLLGINARVVALISLALLFLYLDIFDRPIKITLLFIFVSIFSFSGAFASVSYSDIMGKSILPKKRKSLLSLKIIITAIGVVLSAIMARYLLKTFLIPKSYSYLFFAASFFLFVASLGFYKIKEIINIPKKTINLSGFLKFIKNEIKLNKRFRYYLLTINTLGISLSLMPFLVLFAKKNFNLGYKG